MRKILFLAVLAGVSVHLSSTVHAGELDETRALYKETNRLIRNGEMEKTELVLEPGGWEKIKGEVIPEGRILETADIFSQGGRIRKVIYYRNTPSGDWRLKTEYYFHESGELAFVFQETVTFQGYDFDNDRELPEGPYVIEKRKYFNRRGEETRSLVKAFVKSSGEPIPLKYLRQFDVEIYKSVSSLPFAGVFRKLRGN